MTKSKQSRKVRALNLVSGVLLIFGLWMLVTAIGMYFGDERELVLFTIAVSAGFLVPSALFWWLGQRALGTGLKTRDSVWSQTRTGSGLLLLTPIWVGMLVYHLEIGWIWGVTIVVCWMVMAFALMIDFSTNFVIGDVLSLRRDDGLFYAALVIGSEPAGRGRVYELQILPGPWRERPDDKDLNLDHFAVKRNQGDVRTVRMPTLGLLEAKAEVILPAHEAVSILRSVG